MYPAKFDYVRAHSIDEVFQLLEAKDDAKLMAGGHSLIPMMKLRLAQPETVIDIAKVEGLSGIEKTGDSVRIGALTTHGEIAASGLLREECPLLAQAAHEIGDVQVRSRGTIGGNIAHADPGSDLPAALLALDAQIHLQAKDAQRTVAAKDFFLDLLTTDLGDQELVTAISVACRPQSGSAYLKFEHPASGYAVVGAAAWLQMEAGTCTAGGLAINGVTATPYHATTAIEAVLNTDASDQVLESAAESIQPEDPLSDVFAASDYRAHLARVYARRALAAARDAAS